MYPKKKALALIVTLVSFLTLASEYNSTLAQPSEAFISVPLYRQIKNYYCGPADLEMVFDFYGPDVPQGEIADVARTSADLGGTFPFDMRRAAHFSNLSTSVGTEIPDRNITGYTARKFGYVAFEQWGMTIDDLKSLVAAGYPIIVLMKGHYRVVVGYNATHIITNDSIGPKFNNMTYSTFDANWEHCGLFVSPWNVKLSVKKNVLPGENFTVTANITYPCPLPFPQDEYPATVSNVTITLPDGLSLVPGETFKKVLGDLAPGASASVQWNVHADSAGLYFISVEAEGKISGSVPPIQGYPDYVYDDRIGGSNQSALWVSTSPDNAAPNTTDYYDGLWHNQNFKVNLTATDDDSGVMETFYRINSGPIRTLSLDGQPYISTEGANNTLEYWSVDWVGNEELPHKMLTGIKLDKTPPHGSILINENATYANSISVTLTISAGDTTSGVAKMRFSNNNYTWTYWETYNNSRIWPLTPGDGTRRVYAQFMDNVGLVSITCTDSIILDTTQPIIENLKQTPEGDVQPDQEVKVSANVTDFMSYVKNVTLSYNLNDNAAWVDLPMMLNSTNGLYEALIPRQQANAIVKYRILACDNAGNYKVEDNGGYYYVYIVIPEFPSLIMLPLFMVATLLAVIVYIGKYRLFR